MLVGVPVAAWAAATVWIIASSLDPKQYFQYSFQEPDQFVYPAGAVVAVVLATAAELGVFLLLVRPWRSALSLPRLALALTLLVAWCFLCLQIVMHAPAYLLDHHIWLLGLTSFTAVLLAAVVVGRAGSRFVARRAA